MRHRRDHRFVSPLLAHDAAIALVVIKDIGSRLRDLIAVTVFLALAAALARQALWSLSPNLRGAVMLGGSSTATIVLDIALRRRLRYFRAESTLSSVALADRQRSVYRLTLHLAASVTFAVVLCLPDTGLAARLLLSWWLTLLPVQLLASASAWGRKPSIRAGLVPWLELWRSRAIGTGALSATLAMVVAVALAASLDPYSAGAFVAAILTFGTLTWFSPVDYGVVNFERIAGYPPLRSVRARLGKSLVIALALTAAASASLRVATVVAVGATAVGVLVYRFMTVLLSRILEPHQVGFAMLVLLFSAFSSVFTVPWAAPVLLIVLITWLLRLSNRGTWLLQ